MGGGSSGVSPVNSEVLSSPSPQLQPPQSFAEQPSNTVSSRPQMHVTQQRLLKSESMPVHLSKGEYTLTYTDMYTIWPNVYEPLTITPYTDILYKYGSSPNCIHKI